MQLLSLLTLGFAATALAAPTTEANGNAGDIITALNAIRGKVDEVNGAVSKIKADDPDSLNTLGWKTDELNTVIKTQQGKVSQVPPINFIDALGVASPANDLASSINTMTTNLAAKKDAVAQLGEAKQVAAGLQKSKDGSRGFNDVVFAKLPSAARPIAQQSSNKIHASLQSVIDTYSQ